MTRRSGLIESQPSTVQTPNLGGGAHPAAAQAYDDLRRAAGAISDNIIQPAMDQATQKRATDAVAKGDFSRDGGFMRQSQIYDKVVDAGFMAQASTDIERTIGELENKHLGDLDMDAFGSELAEARSQHLSELDSRYAVPLAQAWDQRGLSATQRLSGIAVQKGLKRADTALEARAGLKLDEISGSSNLDDPNVNLALQEVEQIHAARIAAGNMTQEESDAILTNAISKVEANRIGDEAVKLYEGGGYSESAYGEALKMLDEAMGSTDLKLNRSERAAYLGAARTSLNAARTEQRRLQAEFDRQLRDAEQAARSDFSIAYTDARMSAGEGYAPGPEQLSELAKLAARTGASAGVNLAKIERLGIQYNTQQEMRGRSIPEQEEFVRGLELAAAKGSQDAAVMLDSARKVASASRQAASADPATYAAVTQKRDVPEIDWANPDQTLETMGNRFTEAEIAAKDLGVDVKYFSPGDRAQLKAIADKGGAAALSVASTIVSAADRYGIDPLAVMREIGDSGAPLLATAGALMAQGVPNDAAQKILSGRAAMGSELVKDKMPKQSVQAAAQRTVLGDKLGKMPAASLDALTRSADAHYATTLLENQGQAPGGEKVAYEASMRAVMGEWKDEKGKAWGGVAKSGPTSATVPPWIAKNDFPTIVRTMTPDEVKSAVALNGTLGYYRGRPATMQDYRSAALIDHGAGLYFIAPDPAHPEWIIQQFQTYQMPAVMDLNAIRDQLKTRSPNAVR